MTRIPSLDRIARPSAPSATPSWASSPSAVARSTWLESWDVAERLSTITLSGEPVSTRAASRPRASMSTPAKTNTTSATPPTVSAVVRRRAQRLRQIYENGIRIMAGLSHRPQADNDRRAQDAVCGDGRGGEPREEGRPDPQRHGDGRDVDHGEKSRERLREPFHDREREEQPEHASRERDHQRLAEDEARELAPRE